MTDEKDRVARGGGGGASGAPGDAAIAAANEEIQRGMRHEPGTGPGGTFGNEAANADRILTEEEAEGGSEDRGIARPD